MQPDAFHMCRSHRRRVTQVAAAAATMLLSVGVIGGQTVITPPPNRYSPSQDVELGRQAAAQVEQRLPILGDEEVTSSVASASRRTGARCRAKNAVTFAPEGAYGNAGGQSVFTHGMQIGLARDDTHNLRTATDELIESLARGNPNLSRPSGYDRAPIGGRQGLHTVLSNVSDATGQQERIAVFTTLVGDGRLFYALGVAPRDRLSEYERTFRRVVKSIQIMD